MLGLLLWGAVLTKISLYPGNQNSVHSLTCTWCLLPATMFDIVHTASCNPTHFQISVTSMSAEINAHLLALCLA